MKETLKRKQQEKAKELISALKEVGLDGMGLTTSVTNHGVSTYVQGKGLKFRISDHSVTNKDRVLDEFHYTFDSDVKVLAQKGKERYDEIRSIVQAKTVAWKKDVAERQSLDDFWGEIKAQYENKVFKVMERTYADLESFKKKNSKAEEIVQTNVNGAFRYEWVEDDGGKNKWGHPNNMGNAKPTHTWLKNKQEQSEKSRYNNNEINVKIRNGKEQENSRGFSEDFRNLQEVSLRLPDTEIRSFRDGSTKPDERLRGTLRRVLGGEIARFRSSDGNVVRALSHPTKDIKYDIVADINPQLFHDVFQVVRQYLRSGDAVDLHDNYDNCKCYLSTDGLAGFAIEPDGNLVSVFSLGNGFLSTCGKYMIEQGAKKLDCFESKFQDLPSYYEHCLGFKVVSKLAFNYDIIKEDKGQEYADYFVEKYGEAKVMFMALTEKDIEYKDFGKDDYDLAVSHRDSVFQKCLGLTERYLLKSFKYIRREWKNGKWKYWYEEPEGTVSKGRFGKILRDYVGNPSGAFKRLFKDKRGQAFDVVTLNLPALDIGEDGKFREAYQPTGEIIYSEVPIDLVWGKKTEGLFHILLRHFVQQNDFKTISEAEKVISSNLKNFENDSSSFEVKFNEGKQSFEILSKDKKMFIIAPELGVDSLGQQVVRHFILTSYDNDSTTTFKQNSKKIMKDNYEQIKRKEY